MSYRRHRTFSAGGRARRRRLHEERLAQDAEQRLMGDVLCICGHSKSEHSILGFNHSVGSACLHDFYCRCKRFKEAGHGEGQDGYAVAGS